MQRRDSRKQERTRAQIGFGQQDHRQTVREDQGAGSPHQTGGILLVPRCGVGTQQRATGKGQQTTSKDGAEEHLVQPAVAFDRAGVTDQGDDFGG